MTIDFASGGRARRWRPSPTIAGSMGLHGLAATALVVQPELWAWAAGGIAANHALLTALGLWPRSTLLGPNLVRLPAGSGARREIALTFDDGPDPEATPRVLDLLEAHAARATFFCIGDAARRHAALAREIVRRGHCVENHSLRHHPGFALLGLGGFRREISAAQAAIADATGVAPRFFRPPAGLRNPLLDPILHEQGLRLATWTRRGFDTRTRDPVAVHDRLAAGLAPRDILLLHDGGSARAATGGRVVHAALDRLLDTARRLELRPVTLRQALAA